MGGGGGLRRSTLYLNEHKAMICGFLRFPSFAFADNIFRLISRIANWSLVPALAPTKLFCGQLEIETSLREIETALPGIETALPEIVTGGLDFNQGSLDFQRDCFDIALKKNLG